MEEEHYSKRMMKKLRFLLGLQKKPKPSPGYPVPDNTAEIAEKTKKLKELTEEYDMICDEYNSLECKMEEYSDDISQLKIEIADLSTKRPSDRMIKLYELIKA